MKKLLTIFILTISLAFSASADSLKITENLLTEAIIDNGGMIDYDNNIRINIISGKTLLKASSSENVEVTNFEFDTEKKFFNAKISLSGAPAFKIAGKYKELTKLPVLNRKMVKSEIITADDIGYKEIEASRIMRRGYIADEYALIGKSPTQTLMRGRPISPKQIAEPNMVEKKDMVTLIFKNNLLSMQDLGVAMEQGAMGDMITVKNNSSNKIVQGKIIGDNLVEVSIKRQHLASNGEIYN